MFLFLSFAFAEVCPSPTDMTTVPFTSSATQWGEWSTTEETIHLRKAADKRWDMWSPDDIRLEKGAVRLRVAFGKKPDMTLLVRSEMGSQQNNHISGYGISIENTHAVVYRWTNGNVKALIKKRRLPTIKTVDIHVEFHENHMQFSICNSENVLLEKVTIQDGGASGDRFAVRIHPS